MLSKLVLEFIATVLYVFVIFPLTLIFYVLVMFLMMICLPLKIPAVQRYIKSKLIK